METHIPRRFIALFFVIGLVSLAVVLAVFGLSGSSAQAKTASKSNKATTTTSVKPSKSASTQPGATSSTTTTTLAVNDIGRFLTDKDDKTLIMRTPGGTSKSYPIPDDFDYVDWAYPSNDPNVIFLSTDAHAYSLDLTTGAITHLGDGKQTEVSPDGKWMASQVTTSIYSDEEENDVVTANYFNFTNLQTGKIVKHDVPGWNAQRQISALGWTRNSSSYEYQLTGSYDDNAVGKQVLSVSVGNNAETTVCSFESAHDYVTMLSDGSFVVEDDTDLSITEPGQCAVHRLPSVSNPDEIYGVAGSDKSHIVVSVRYGNDSKDGSFLLLPDGKTWQKVSNDPNDDVGYFPPTK